MYTNALAVCLAACMLALPVAVGCATSASSEEVTAACRHLEKIRGGESPDGVEERLNKCRQDLGREGVSSKVAQCRAKARNVDTFWNSCR